MRDLKLSVVIPTKDRGEIFDRTFCAAREAVKHIDAEIIIVNDSHVPLAVQSEGQVRVVQNPKGGVASARNFGASHAKGEWLLFLDDDIIISRENIEHAYALMEQYSDAAFNFNWVYPPEMEKKISSCQFGRYLRSNGYTSLKGWNRGNRWEDGVFEINLLASFFLLIRKKDFSRLGGYNEVFPHAGAEDYDFARRLKSSGLRNLCNTRSTVYHNESDKIDLQVWLKRKETAAKTRRLAVTIGYPEMAITSSRLKEVVIPRAYFLRGFFMTTLRFIPNKIIFDPLYCRIINFLFSLYLYRGYYKSA